MIGRPNDALCEELYALTGWLEHYDLSFLVTNILTVHQIKFRYEKTGTFSDTGKVIASAPQMYRFEADTAEDAACMMLIALVKNGVIK